MIAKQNIDYDIKKAKIQKIQQITKTMIQQRQQQNYSIKSKFNQLYQNQHIDVEEIKVFVKNLYQFQYQQSGIGVLYQLGNCLVGELNNNSQLNHNQQIFILSIVSEMIQMTRKQKYTIGILQISQMIRNIKIKQLIKNILISANTDNKNINYFKKAISILIKKQTIIELSTTNQKINVILGRIMLLLNIPQYLMIVSQYQQMQNIIQNIGKLLLYFIKQQSKLSNKQHLDFFFKSCVEFDHVYFQLTRTMVNRGCCLASDCVIEVLMADNLERKFVVLANLDQLLNFVKSKKIVLEHRFSDLIKLILDPRNHPQVLNRSLGFLKYWFENSQKQTKIWLNIWLNDLIMRADSWTSSIFGKGFTKMINSIQQIGQYKVLQIYDIVIQILKKMLLVKDEKLKKKIKIQLYKKQLQIKISKIISILSSLINKKFQPFQIHQKNTYQFLEKIWKIKQKCDQHVKIVINQNLYNTIFQLISPNFNHYILKCTLNQLHTITQQIIGQRNNIQKYQNNILYIYNFINKFLLALNKFDSQQQINGNVNSLSYFDKKVKEVGSVGIGMLINNEVLNNLIFCHNTNSQDQLRLLLQLMAMIIQRLNQPSFQNHYLCALINKVKIASQLFLSWLRGRLQKTCSNDIKKSIAQNLFKLDRKYQQLTLKGLNNLLYISLISQIKKQNKQIFYLNLLKQIKYNLIQDSIYIILNFLWNHHQICSPIWLENFINKIDKLEFKQSLIVRVFACMEIIRISEQKNTFVGESIFSQQIAMRQQIAIQVTIINEKHISKKLACWDSISLQKLKKLQIEPMLTSQLFQQLAIQSINLENRQFTKKQMFLSLRKLGFTSQGINKIYVRMKYKAELILKQIKDWEIYNTITHWYKNQYTKNIQEFCERHRLTQLKKQFGKQSKRLKLESKQLTKKSMLTIIQLLIKKILQYKYHGRQKIDKISKQMVYLFQLFNNNHQNQISYRNVGYQRKFISDQQIFITFGDILLQSSQKMSNNSTRLFIYQQIGYQFMSMLITNSILNYQCGNLSAYINLNLNELPYIVLYGLQITWMLIKSIDKMKMLIESQIPRKILQKIKESMIIIIKQKQKYENLNIYLQIIGTGIKIINIIIKIILIQQKLQSTCLIARKSQYLLQLKQTKKNIQQITNNSIKMSIINNSSEILFINNLLLSSKQKYHCTFQLDQIVNFFQNMCIIMENGYQKLSKHDIFLVFYQISKVNCWIAKFLNKDKQKYMIQFLTQNLNSKCPKINKTCQSLLYIYLKFDYQNCIPILQSLLSVFKRNKPNSSQYFEILNQCYKQCTNSQMIQQITEQFFKYMMNIQQQQRQHQQNYLLQGITQIISQNINKIDQKYCQQYALFLFNSFLFYSHQGKIKAAHWKTRAVLYQGIVSSLNYYNNINSVKFIDDVKQQINMAGSTNMVIKDVGMGVGLNNLGNICYLNAQMQLLHSIKKFVKGVQKIKTNFPLLLGLQQLLIKMTYSLQKSISPQQFILSFDPPLNITLQEDTTQFLTQFIQKISIGDKSNKFKQLINKLFTGKTQSKITCYQCKKSKKEVQDNFIFYQISLKNQQNIFNNIYQCIQNNKRQQILYDVYCQYCNKKNKFIKSTIIKIIPQYFFIHLRRLIFDFQQPHRKIKIHSQLEFTQKLIINQEILYLKSVITHSGSGQYGHYITSIKDNQKWLVYNDSQVSEMTANGKQQLWNGEQVNMGESANAYVLLYEKQGNLPTNNNQMVIQNEVIAQNLKQIKETNKKLMLKYLLFSDKYKTDFLQFAHGLVCLPQTPQKMIKIYELLALISYQSGLAPLKPARQYFNILLDNSDPNKLVSLIYKYKQYNNEFIFHKKKQLREFFCVYLQYVFNICTQQNKQIILYSCELLKIYLEYLIEDKYFINSNQLIKLLSYIFNKQKNNKEYIKYFYQNKIIQYSYQLFKNKKIQIKFKYQSHQIQLMESFLLFSWNFVSLARNSNNSIILYVNQYQQSVQFIQNCIYNDMDYIQLMFMSNTNKNNCILLLQLLQLSKNEKFIIGMIDLIGLIMSQWNKLDGKTSKNLCDMIEYVFKQLNIVNKEKICTGFYNVFGYAFPYYLTNNSNNNIINNNGNNSNARLLYDARVTSLKQRSYSFLTNRLSVGLMQIITKIIFEILKQPKINIQNIEILHNLLKLKMRLLQNNEIYLIYINYMINLSSPIVLFGTYLQFQQNMIEQIINKIYSDYQINQLNNIRQYLQNYKFRINTLSQQITQKQQNDSIICGEMSNQPKLILQKLICDKLFLTVQDYQYYWCFHLNNKLILIKFVDHIDMKLNVQHQKDQQLIKLIKPVLNCQIQQEGQSSRTNELNNVMQLDIQQHPEIYRSIIRRKLILANVSDRQLAIMVRIEGRNIKNNIIQLNVKLGCNQSKEIWVQKRKMIQNWSQMKITINGVQINIVQNQEMIIERDNINSMM